MELPPAIALAGAYTVVAEEPWSKRLNPVVTLVPRYDAGLTLDPRYDLDLRLIPLPLTHQIRTR
jgi:hypothetical protein